MSLNRWHRGCRAVITASRREAGLSQRELADRIRKPQSFVAKIETGRKKVYAAELILLAHGMGKDPAVLIRRIDSW